MSIFRILTILVLVGLIFGGAAYFAYELYWKPQELDREDKAAKLVQAAPTPIPDYSLPAYNKAVSLQQSGDIEGARVALAEFIRGFPDAPNAPAAKSALGEINAGRVFSPTETTNKASYAVVKGDSLVRIASKFKSNAELIFRANNLESINLKIGQTLLIPQLDTSIVVDRQARTVTVFNHGEFFKEYPATSVKIPGSAAPIKTKVADKLALQGTIRVPFGDKNYPGSERWLMLGTSGVALRGLSEADGSAPAGIILSPADMEEIFVLVSQGSPVTIN